MRKKLISLITISTMVVCMTMGASGITWAETVKGNETPVAIDIAEEVEESIEVYGAMHPSSNGIVTNVMTKKQYKLAKKQAREGVDILSDTGRIPSSYTAPYTNIKNQGMLGTCWAFGTIAAMESNYLVKQGAAHGLYTGSDVDFSEAQLVYAAYNPETVDGENVDKTCGDYYMVSESDEDCYGYNQGGFALTAASRILNGCGIADESDSEYIVTNWDGAKEAALTMAEKSASVYGTTKLGLIGAYFLPNIYPLFYNEGGFSYGNIQSNRDIWKKAINKYGALTAGYYVPDTYDEEHERDNLYSFWIANPSPDNREDNENIIANHQISIIGYDDDYSRFLFKDEYTGQKYDDDTAVVVDVYEEPTYDDNHHLTNDPLAETEVAPTQYLVPKTDGAWQIKNSWGKEYSDMWMSYYEKTLTDAFAFEVEDHDFNSGESDYDSVYQHDGVAAGVYYGDEDLAGANVFTISDDTILDALQILTNASNTEVKASIYLGGESGKPTSGTLVDEISESVSRAGYSRISTSRPIALHKGDKVSVVVSMYSEDYDSTGSIELQFLDTGNYLPIESEDGGCSGNFDANICNKKGTTYIYQDGMWIDSITINKFSSSEIGNIPVKLLTNKTKIVDIPKANTGLVYNGNEQIGVPAGSEYQITGNTQTNAGTYKAVLALVDKDNTCWSDGTTTDKQVEFTIQKATPNVTVSGKTKTVKYKTVKKKSTYTTAVSVSGAKGTKFFYKTGGSSKLTISKSTGKIRVKKGTKKKTYTIKVMVSSAATANYNAKSSTVKTIKVRVK